MNEFRRGVLILVALVGTATAARAQQPEVTSTPPSRIVEGRQLSLQFGTELKSALEHAIAQGGPASAILVCRDEAPRIAARLSQEHGVRVSRTALKVRNPSNAPKPWQRAGLEKFQSQLASGAKAETLELIEPQPGGGGRYLKAIVTAPLCTVCHGDSIAPDVQRALRDHYPRDQATGFKVGDLRGAFSIEWPAAKAKTP